MRSTDLFLYGFEQNTLIILAILEKINFPSSAISKFDTRAVPRANVAPLSKNSKTNLCESSHCRKIEHGELHLSHSIKRRLLVVDDVADICDAIGYVAETLGYETKLTTSSHEFCDQFELFQPTHIALDLEMPGQNGIELIKWMATKPSRPKIIIISGNPRLMHDAVALTDTLGLHKIAALGKPFKLASLTEVLSIENQPTELNL